MPNSLIVTAKITIYQLATCSPFGLYQLKNGSACIWWCTFYNLGNSTGTLNSSTTQ